MEIVVRLKPHAAEALQTQPPESAGLTGLASVVAESGAGLTPQFPGIADSELASYYTLTGVPDDDAERITAALRELDEVDAAYEQPSPFPA